MTQQYKNMENTHNSISISAIYHQTWQDGYGARGWKLNFSVNDPAIIASTSETGAMIPTSVFVHDILDHYISGFEISGHRAEAMALTQLHLRTSSNYHDDLLQLIDEDVIYGRVNGEPLETFLPPDLRQQLPIHTDSNKKKIQHLIRIHGKESIRQKLLERFIEFGNWGKEIAKDHWKKHGLVFDNRKKIGLAIQSLLVQTDKVLLNENIDSSRGVFKISNTFCEVDFSIDDGKKMHFSAAV